MAKKDEALIKLEEQRLKLQTEQAKNTNKLIDKALPMIERYVTTKLEKIEAPRFAISSLIFSVILGIIIIGSAWLVYVGKLADSNFTFLIGIVLGYLMVFMKNAIFVERDE